MNTRFYNFFGVLCVFPTWIFRSNFGFIDLVKTFIIFAIVPFFFNYLIIKKNSHKYNFQFLIWLSVISFYCVDQNIGLWGVFKDGFFSLSFISPYFTSLIYSLILILIFYLIFYFIKFNGIKILFPFLLVIFLFNIFDKNKYYSNFPQVDLSKNIQSSKKMNQKKIVFVFDEMSGLNSIDSEVENGEEVNQYIIDFFQEYNFDIYINAYALYRDTDKSLGSIFNFVKDEREYESINRKNNIHFIKKSKNYYVSNDLIENKFFDLDQNENIVVTQSMYINYCNHPKVIICNQFNPYNEELDFLQGFKDTKLTRYFSYFRNNGSVSSFFIWRVLLELRYIDTLLDPGGEKASIRFILDNLVDNINTFNESTLFFSHILVPHIPFAYDKNCNFDGDKTINFNRIGIKEKRLQHNLEKKCLINFLEDFFDKLKLTNKFDDFEILIFSDHDSRFINSKKISNNIIYVHKRIHQKKSEIFYNNVSVNNLFNDLYFE